MAAHRRIRGGGGASHCITWFQTQLIPHYVSDPLPQPLWDHRSTGQLVQILQNSHFFRAQETSITEFMISRNAYIKYK